MIRSMTGFGAAAAEAEGCRFSVEVKSVNNRFFKCTVRLPEELAAFEADIETLIGKRLSRGSVSVSVRFVPGGRIAGVEINPAAVRALLSQLMDALPIELRDRATVDLASLLAAPGITHTQGGEALLAIARPVVVSLVEEAAAIALVAKTREGAELSKELVRYGEVIRTALDAVSLLAPAAVKAYEDRLRTRMTALLAEAGAKVDEGMMLREVAVFAERSDIAEEITRLSGHLAQYTQVISPTHSEAAGRTLDFLAQEMLREANTIASKSQEVEIARRVVEMKTAIDRIKEQSQNAE